jgi:hypothetical protein
MLKVAVIFSSMIKGDSTLKIRSGLFHEIHNEPEKEEVFWYLRQWLDEHLKTFWLSLILDKDGISWENSGLIIFIRS